MNSSPQTIGGYLLERLQALGLKHIFGVPGDYILSLYKLIEESPIEAIGTTREDCAGFAADAYARINGIGCACVTYCVGGLNSVNAVACAYAERSPVVLLSGSPGLGERVRNPHLHHMVRDFNTQREVYEKITVAAVALDDPLTARRTIDQTLAALKRYKRPVYIEIPRDLVNAPLADISSAYHGVPDEVSDADALAEAIDEIREMIADSKYPVVLAGAEIQRFGLQGELLKFVERANMPVATTLLGKSVIPETHPLFVGVYSSLIARDEVATFMQEADCLLILGSIVTDLDLVGSTLATKLGNTIHATADKIAIRRHHYEEIHFDAFMRALADADALPSFNDRPLPKAPDSIASPANDDVKVTLQNLFAYLNANLPTNTIVVADVGESLFASADLLMHHETDFLGPAYYTSMGFATPATIGVGFASPHLRPLLIVGDGAFQMTGTELSTAVRYGHVPIVLVLNNHGYSTERAILDGPFNDIAEWRFDHLPALIGGGKGWFIDSFGELKTAYQEALSDASQVHILNIQLSSTDRSQAMQRVANRLAEKL